MLKLYARAGHRMYYRGTRGGQIPRYIGRKTKIVPPEEQDKVGALATHRATREPAEIEESSDDGREVLRRMQIDRNDPPLWPADEETARKTGVPMPSLKYSEKLGEWLESATSNAGDAPAGDSPETKTTKKGSSK